MQLNLTQLKAHLGKGLQRLYTLHGDEPLLVQESADLLRATARQQGFAERQVFTVSGAHFDWSAVLAACGSMSLFADKQLIELRLPTGKPGKDGAQVLQNLAQIAQADESILLLVILPKLDRATLSSAWFGALDSGVTIAVGGIERAALPQWIAQRLAVQGQRVEPGQEGQRCLQFFADRVEGNLLAAHQEIQKLALLYEPGELSFDQVERAVLNVARYDVFKLSEAVLAGQIARVQRMLAGLQAEGEAEVLVHYTLSEDIRALKRVKDAVEQGKPMPMALREQRVWGGRERLFERVLPRMTPRQLRELLAAAHVVDGVIKGLRAEGWPGQPWQALHQLAMLIAQACQGPQAPRQRRSVASSAAAL